MEAVGQKPPVYGTISAVEWERTMPTSGLLQADEDEDGAFNPISYGKILGAVGKRLDLEAWERPCPAVGRYRLVK